MSVRNVHGGGGYGGGGSDGPRTMVEVIAELLLSKMLCPVDLIKVGIDSAVDISRTLTFTNTRGQANLEHPLFSVDVSALDDDPIMENDA